MKLFECQNCGQPLYFENTKCESCGLRLGSLPMSAVIPSLEADTGVWRPLAAKVARSSLSATAEPAVWIWLGPAANNEFFSAPCRHNRTIPDLTDPENLVHWRKIEYAKHRLF